MAVPTAERPPALPADAAATRRPRAKPAVGSARRSRSCSRFDVEEARQKHERKHFAMRLSMALVLLVVQCNHAPAPRTASAELPSPTTTSATTDAVSGEVHAVAQIGHRGEMWALAWSPRGDLLATGSLDHSIRIWDDHGEVLGILRGHREAITDLSWSPRGDV